MVYFKCQYGELEKKGIKMSKYYIRNKKVKFITSKMTGELIPSNEVARLFMQLNKRPFLVPKDITIMSRLGFKVYLKDDKAKGE